MSLCPRRQACSSSNCEHLVEGRSCCRRGGCLFEGWHLLVPLPWPSLAGHHRCRSKERLSSFSCSHDNYVCVKPSRIAVFSISATVTGCFCFVSKCCDGLVCRG